MRNYPIIISIEGNIGSGKSTLMEYLKNNFNNYLKSKSIELNNLNICYLQEPVDVWNTFIDKNGSNIIEAYYANQEKYAFPFQMMAYISRISQLKNAINEGYEIFEGYDIIFTERSIYTDKNVFAKMLYDDNKIGEIEYKIYNKWFCELSDCLKNVKTLYVRSDPKTCFDRVIKRNRKGETIPLEYLKCCNNYHNDWLKNVDDIIIVNGNINNEENSDYYNIIMEKILKNLYNNNESNPESPISKPSLKRPIYNLLID